MTEGKWRWPGILGIVLYVPSAYLYLAAGLMVPGIGLLVLWACWIVGLVLVVKTARSRPALSLIGLPAAVAFWAGYVSAGSAIFGWTA